MNGLTTKNIWLRIRRQKQNILNKMKRNTRIILTSRAAAMIIIARESDSHTTIRHLTGRQLRLEWPTQTRGLTTPTGGITPGITDRRTLLAFTTRIIHTIIHPIITTLRITTTDMWEAEITEGGMMAPPGRAAGNEPRAATVTTTRMQARAGMTCRPVQAWDPLPQAERLIKDPPQGKTHGGAQPRGARGTAGQVNEDAKHSNSLPGRTKILLPHTIHRPAMREAAGQAILLLLRGRTHRLIQMREQGVMTVTRAAAAVQENVNQTEIII